jgi:predicted DNA-binding ribbon-helix-helix protein
MRQKPSDLKGAAAIEAKIEEIRRDTARARKDGSHTAVSSLSKLEIECLRWLDEARQEEDTARGVDPAEMAEILIAGVAEIDDVTFRRLAAAVDERRHGLRRGAAT